MSSVAKILLVLVAIIALIELSVALNVEITTESMQCTVGESVNITAQVLNNSIPQNNTLVNFTTTFGYLSALSAYTNGSGIAVVWINSTTSGNATLNASVGSAYNTTNVSFIPDTPTTIAINVSLDPLVAGNTTEVNLTSYDQYHNVNYTADMTINILIANVLGETVHEINITRAPYTVTGLAVNQTDVIITDSVNNFSSVLLSINSTVAGNITITANTGAVTNNTNITFTPAAPHTISTLYDDAYTVNTTSTITVSVYDMYENPVNNMTVLFNATPPPDTKYNSPIEYNSLQLAPLSSTTGPDGLAQTLFRTDKRAGDNTINITVMNTSINTTIIINGLRDTIDDVHLTHKPDQVYANNADAYSLSAQVVDKFQNPLLPTSFPIVDMMLFTTASGSTLIPLNENGTATTLAGPTSYIETITITATYKNETGYTNLTNTTNLSFVRGNLASFIFYANPTAVLAWDMNGNHNSTLALIALDEWGHALPNICVTLNNTNTSLGNLTVTGINTTNLINTSTDPDGRIKAVFTSRSFPGNTTITATNGSLNASTIVEIKDQPFLSIEITAEPATLDSGDVVNVTTIISVEGELPITRPAASAMLVLDRSGSMDPDYYAGTPLDLVLVLDRSGSMKFLGSDPQQPMTDAKTAAKVFMDNLVSNAQVGVVSFESSVATEIGLTLLNSSDNKALVRNAINDIYVDGGTAIGDGLARANTLLTGGRGDARKITILLTDGQCTAGSDKDCSQAISDANANGITIYTIGLGSTEYIDEPLLHRVASETGGRYYNAPSSSELTAVYNSIAQEISDYDITEIEYGTEGFTPYDYATESTVVPVNTSPPYILKFDAYDIDDTNEDCYIYINGNYFDEILPPTGNENWGNFEYDITSLVQNGTNVVTFYDTHNYDNAIRNFLILANGTVIAREPSYINLVQANPYRYRFDTSYYSFEDTFLINETINDLKVLLQWENSITDLNLKLTSPGGDVYYITNDTTGYYFDDREAVSIDLRTPEFDTYIASANPDTVFADMISFDITDDQSGTGEQKFPIMQWKLPSTPTHNARIESVTMYLHGMTPTIDPGTESRSINIYDLTTGYDDDPTWNYSDSSTAQTWVSGGNFSAADIDPYLIDSVDLTSSIIDDVVEFDITGANWSGNHVPDWGESCNIVLVGDGYDGAGADRFASSETSTEDHHYTLNGWQPLVTITYSIPEDSSEYIWIHPLPYTYPDTDFDTVENGNWIVQVTTDSLPSEPDPSTASTDIWLNANVTAGSNTTYYLYYGNPNTTSSLYDGDDVFAFYQDFENGMPALSSLHLKTSQDQTGTWGLENNFVNHGHYSFHLNNGNSWKDQTLPDIDLSTGYMLGFSMLYHDPGEILGIGLHDGTITGDLDTDGLFYTIAGSDGWGDEMLSDPGMNEWGKYEVNITSGWANYQGGTTVLKNLTYVGNDDSDHSTDAYWDYIYIRKHVDPDPATSVGGEETNGTWWNASWSYRMPITILEQSGNDLALYPVNITIDTPVLISNNKIRSDLKDIRIIDDTGNEVPWVARINGRSTLNESFNITTYIDKKSAAKLGAHAFLSSFDETRGDKTGLVLYSNDNVVNTNVQTSYLRNDSTWSGYFTVDTNGIYDFNLSWDDASDIDLYLYEGTTLLNSSTGSSKPKVVSSSLFAGTNYHVMASKILGTENGTRFTINVSSSSIHTAICGYYDSTGGGGVPRYRVWDGGQWSDESSANFVDGSIRWIVMESCPTRDEVIMGTLDSYKDINIQLWDGSAWGAVQEFSMDAYDKRRGFDIAYEGNSGDAVVVYRNSAIDNSVPRYRVWDGSVWSAEDAVNATDAGNKYIQWVRLIAKPDSDELMLAFLNNDYDLRTQIWNGTAWCNAEVLTTSGRTYSYQCFDAVYEQGTGNGMIVWAQSDNTVRYAIWDGLSWSTPSTIYTDTASPYWIKLASDPNSNNVLMSVLNSGKDVRVSAWNGTAWSSVLKIEENTYEYNKRIMDVAFDQSNGNGMVVWGDSTPTPKYRIWDGSWGSESSASNLGGSGYTRWVHLSSDPHSDKIFLMTSDGNNDINIQQWDGNGWNVPDEAETSSSRNYECFDIAYQRHNISIANTSVSWTEWRATVTSTFNNDSLIHLNNSIDTITADGLTAIDEGIYMANNELAGVTGNSTMVLMTDGLDNAGYNSLLLEAQRAMNNNTVIYTVGLGNSESEIDPVLSKIANITGGEYYFAPNASVLKDIFRGIAASITNFTAEGPALNIHLPHNYITNLSVATATYVPNSSNATTGNAVSFVTPTSPNMGNAEPNTTIVGNESILLWTLPNLNPGEKWGVWYQLTVQGAGFVPLILPTSTVTYTDVNGTSITINISYGGGSSIGGSAANVDYLALGNLQMNVNPPVILIGDPSTITLSVTYDDNNPAVAYVILDTNLGYFDNYQNPVNITVSGSDTVDFRSATAGRAYINAVAYNANNTVNDSAMILVNPKGKITIS